MSMIDMKYCIAKEICLGKLWFIGKQHCPIKAVSINATDFQHPGSKTKFEIVFMDRIFYTSSGYVCKVFTGWVIGFLLISFNLTPVITLSCLIHYGDAIMGAIASQITSLTVVYSTVYSDTDQRKHQSSVSLTFVLGIHQGPVNSLHKWPVTWKMFPFDDVIMLF